MYQRLFTVAHREQVVAMVQIDSNQPTDDADRLDVVNTVPNRPLGDLPLVVIAAFGYRPDAADRADWRARQTALAALSTKGRLVVLEQQQHFVPLLEPKSLERSPRARDPRGSLRVKRRAWPHARRLRSLEVEAVITSMRMRPTPCSACFFPPPSHSPQRGGACQRG